MRVGDFAIPRLVCVLILLAKWQSIAFGADPRMQNRLAEQEVALVQVFEAIQQGQSEKALREVDRLIAQHPNFRLAHLIRGDLLSARSGTLSPLGSTVSSRSGGRVNELRAEALARLRAYSDPSIQGKVPTNLLQISHDLKHVIVVDASRSRLYVYENRKAAPVLVADFYATLGKQGVDKFKEGDQRTPLGVYRITSRIPGQKLPDLYGWGAFPIDYPNEWDRRTGRTGYGIWLHGVPSDTFARAPFASDGCIALSNSDMVRLAKLVQIGATPVVIADRIDWESPDSIVRERDAFTRQIEAWRLDWESRDTQRYLSHYARDFRVARTDLQAWSKQKVAANRSKSWVKVTLSNVSIFRGHDKRGLMVVTFDQDYRSNNLSQKSRKRQYWVQEAGRWKIAYEGTLADTSVALPESYRTPQKPAPTRTKGQSG
jgi:murein L,D-transpeptidase YafK